jgi:hypothetical protein
MFSKFIELFRRIDNSVHNHYNTPDPTKIQDKAREDYAYCQEGDAVVVDFALTQDPPRVGNLRETYIVQTTNNDVKIRVINGDTPNDYWVPKWVITSNLGKAKHYWTKEQLAKYGIVLPDPLPLVTGTFIRETKDERFHLVEIDKVNGVYLIHDVNDSQAEILEPDHDYVLHTFSKPDEGEYILEPGMYLDDDNKILEVVPFKGICWYRSIDDSEIYALDNIYAVKLNRIETDDPGVEYYLLGVTGAEEENETNLKVNTPEVGSESNPTDPI